MNSYNRDLISIEKALHHRYINDCRAIEDRQDAVRKQKRDVDELNRSMYDSSMRLRQRLNAHTGTHDMHAFQLVTACLDDIVYAQDAAQQSFTWCQEELTKEERRLAEGLEERRQRFKDDIRMLDGGGGQGKAMANES